MNRSQALASTLLGCSLVVMGCVPEAVQWDAAESRVRAVAAPQSRLVLIGSGPAMVAGWVPPLVPSEGEVGAACRGTMVTALSPSDTAYAAWWAPQPDSSARLVVSRSVTGGLSWERPVVADSLDRSHAGCRRDPPAITIDAINGYVAVVYFLQAREGPGIFYTHSMDRGKLFHEPVPIVYGERRSYASVASSGDTVVVAYTDPNASEPQVWLATSQTTGHIFEQRTAVSSGTAVASLPLVAVHGRRVAVSWFETPRGGGTGVTVVRTGVLR